MQPVGNRLELIRLTAYLIAVGLSLRIRGRIRPNVGLPLLLARATQVTLFSWLGPRACALRRIEARGGSAYTGQLPAWLGARSDAEGGSRLVLCEDGRPLPFPHAPDAAVEQVGGGRYYHWYTRIVFSSSDGSDPRSNGRRYTVEVVRR